MRPKPRLQTRWSHLLRRSDSERQLTMERVRAADRPTAVKLEVLAQSLRCSGAKWMTPPLPHSNPDEESTQYLGCLTTLSLWRFRESSPQQAPSPQSSADPP